VHVAVIFCAEPEQEHRQNENCHSFFGRSEEEFLPEAIEFKTPACFQLAKVFGVNSWFVPFGGDERVPIGNFP
jgi:hypothetical protein